MRVQFAPEYAGIGLAACAPLPKVTGEAPVPALLSRPAGGPVLPLQTEDSLITLHVRRGGPLARLGHDHVIASHEVTGWVAPERGEAELTVPLDHLTVDEPALRAKAGLDPDVEASAVAGTARNLKTRVLDVAHYPLASVRVARQGTSPFLDMQITVHGVTHRQTVKAAITTRDDGAWVVAGEMTLRQSDFGLTPFAVLGGALRVEDEMTVTYRLVTVTRAPG